MTLYRRNLNLQIYFAKSFLACAYEVYKLFISQGAPLFYVLINEALKNTWAMYLSTKT